MVDKYLGIVLVSVILFFLFRDATGTKTIISALSGFNTNAISALQGRGNGLTLN